jgi:hypothetical protein
LKRKKTIANSIENKAGFFSGCFIFGSIKIKRKL